MENAVVKLVSVMFIAFAIGSSMCHGGNEATSSRVTSSGDRTRTSENMDPQQRKPLPGGTWGGRGIQMSVNSDGASIEFDCADGEIPGQIYIREDGTFSTDGTFTKRRPGPVRPNEPPPAAARYTGRLNGSKMTLKITLTADGDDVGEYTLEQGKSGRVVRCL